MIHRITRASLKASAAAALSLALLGAGVPLSAQDETQEITTISAGPIELMSTIGDARRAAPDLTFARGYGQENSVVVDVMQGETLVMQLWTDETIEFDENGDPPPLDNLATVIAIDIFDPRYRTVEGVHVGMSADAAEQRLGRLAEMRNFPHSGETPNFIAQPDYLVITMRAGEGTDTAGDYFEITGCDSDYPPMCQVARRFNPGAEIASLSIGNVAPIPKKVIEISGLPEGWTITRSWPSGEKCTDEPVSTYTIWNEAHGPNWFQTVDIPNIAPCMEEDEPFERITYDEQSFIYLGDYNFDGMIDLALNNGSNGGYGSSSYQIYFYDDYTNTYVERGEFTELAHSLGMFDVDPEKKLLTVYAKSGAAWHQRSDYKVVNNSPQLVHEVSEEYTGDGKVLVTTRTLKKGKWKTKVTKRKAEDE